MGKILASWSGMRKYLEQEMIADCLKGRVRYNCTTYTGMDGCRIFEIFIDKKLVKQFSWETLIHISSTTAFLLPDAASKLPVQQSIGKAFGRHSTVFR